MRQSSQLSPRDLKSETDSALKDALVRALAFGGRPVARLGAAGTSVTFEVTDAADQSVTLLLDRQPPEAVAGTEPAEITIELDRDQAVQFATGDLILPNCILHNEVVFRGPVRKYLSLDAVLRSLLARAKAESP